MRVCVVHGYFLSDSGSGIYVRELCRELVAQSHEVTLVCQEQAPEELGFIDELWVGGPAGPGAPGPAGDVELTRVWTRPGDRPIDRPGCCRMARPDLGGRLLVYVDGPFPPFEASAFQDASDERIDEYVERNVGAVAAVLSRWPPDLVIANHTIMQPVVVRRALEKVGARRGAGTARPPTGPATGPALPPYVVTIHGSALNFSVKPDPRLHPYALEGLAAAAAVAALSDFSRSDIVEWAAKHGLDMASKSILSPPGVDTELFAPVADRGEALRTASSSGAWLGAAEVGPDADVLVFAGRLMWTKGAQYAVAAMPWVLAERPDTHLVIAGDGPARGPLGRLVEFFHAGDVRAARGLLAAEAELRPGETFGPVLPESAVPDAARGRLADRVHFVGHIEHELLARLFAAADVSLAPSVFAEAFALVSVEALSAGAVPLATYQTGLMAPMDVVSGELEDPACCRLTPDVALTSELARDVLRVLNTYRTRDPAFRSRLHRLAEERFSWRAVATGYARLARPARR